MARRHCSSERPPAPCWGASCTSTQEILPAGCTTEHVDRAPWDTLAAPLNPCLFLFGLVWLVTCPPHPSFQVAKANSPVTPSLSTSSFSPSSYRTSAQRQGGNRERKRPSEPCPQRKAAQIRGPCMQAYAKKMSETLITHRSRTLFAHVRMEAAPPPPLAAALSPGSRRGRVRKNTGGGEGMRTEEMGERRGAWCNE